MKMHNLFPQPVAMYSLDRDLTTKELSFIKNQEIRSNVNNSTSVNSFLLKCKELTKLRDFIETSVHEYFHSVHNPKDKVDLRITQSWANYTKPGEAHHLHDHPNSFVSGVFYPQANRKTDRIYFYKSGFQQIKLIPENWNLWNSDSWWLEVGTGDLVIFPSSLQHMVRVVGDEETRISIAFNTFPIGCVGEELGLTELTIGEQSGSLRIS
jgi:uncharacterized protein (TIGR02466 family)